MSWTIYFYYLAIAGVIGACGWLAYYWRTQLQALALAVWEAVKTKTTAPAGPPRPSHDPIPTYPWLYPAGLATLTALYAIVALFCLGSTFSLAGETFDAGITVLTVGLLHFATGIRLANRTHLGGILVLGYPTIEVVAGIIIAPALVFEFATLPLAPIDIRVPRSPDKVFRGKKGDHWPEGYEEPLRVPFAGRKHDDLPAKIKTNILSDDPLLKRATEEVSFFVRFAVEEGNFFDFHVRIGTYENAWKQIKDLGIAKINEDFTKISVAEALAQLESYNKEFEHHLGEATESWGADIVTGKVSIQLSYSMNQAIESIPQAQAEAQAIVLKATGNREKLKLEGQGRGAAMEAELEGKGKGQKKQMTELGITDANVVIGAEVADSIAKGNNEKIVLVGADGFVKLAANLTQSLTEKAQS